MDEQVENVNYTVVCVLPGHILLYGMIQVISDVSVQLSVITLFHLGRC